VTRALAALALLLAGCATTSPGTPRVLPPPPPEIAHTEGWLTGTGGTRLYEQAWLPKDADPRAVLIVVHGLKDHSARYADVAIDFARQGIAVYAFDLRGHGRSEGERVWVDKFDDYLADLGLFVDSVRERQPRKPLFLFGHSMGGAIVTLYTLTREPYLQGLILSGPAFHVAVAGPVIGTVKLLSSLAPGTGVLSLDPEDFSRDKAVVEAGREDPLVYQPSGPARTAAELFRAMERIDALAPELSVPVLFLHGTADKVTDPLGSKSVYGRAASKDKTLKLYDGLYHDLLHEPERATVEADFLAWVGARAHFGPATPAP
jgi:acylglycerol lipase